MSSVAFDLFAPEIRQDPYPYYHKLRRIAPVHRFEEQGFWCVSRYADVTAVLKDADCFSSSVMAVFDATLLGADPPSHTRIRKLVSGAFSSRRLATLSSRIRTITNQLIDSIITSGKCELVGDFAAPLPLSVIAEILEIAERGDDLKRWSNAIVAGATGTPSAKEMSEISDSMQECSMFLREHVERCRRQSSHGILSELLLGGSKEERLSPEEAVSLARLLLLAGNETTTNLIGNAVLALLRDPGEMEMLRLNIQLIPTLVDEVLRHDPPVQFVYRLARKEVEIRGVRVRSGERVMALLGAANRDPAQFPNPDRFCVARNPQNHLTFGVGPHYCLGAYLARLEARIALEALLTRFRALRAIQPLNMVELVDSVQLRGPRRLELAFEPDW